MKSYKEAFFLYMGLSLASFLVMSAIIENQFDGERQDVAAHLKQLQPGDASLVELKRDTHRTNFLIYSCQWMLAVCAGGFGIAQIAKLNLFKSRPESCEAQNHRCKSKTWEFKNAIPCCLGLVILFSAGCQAPFQPNDLQVIQSNEYVFMLPFTEDVGKQERSENEQYLKKNMVFAKQIKIPQQWVQTGFAWWGRNSMNGSWKPAAMLIRVVNSPVTREWTADPMSGTGNKNEAVWVMTSDQVEFSTGWSCTGRIASEDDAVRFLHNYPNGTLEKVLDSEVRMKLATEFAMEVTDLPMEKLRKDATPHLKATSQRVIDFFQTRGITITNLGITGGFVYKDVSVQEMLVKVFNAEQQKSLAIAATQAQEETNKKIQLEASGKADARLKESKAEADAIKLVADAKEYELTKAKDNIEVYLALKRLEIEAKKVEKWEGKFPTTYFGEKPPDMMLTVPAIK